MGLRASLRVELAVQAGHYLAYKLSAHAEGFGNLRDGPHAAVNEAVEYGDYVLVFIRQLRQHALYLVYERQAFGLLLRGQHRAELRRAVPGIIYLGPERLEGAGEIEHSAHPLGRRAQL